MIVSHRKCAFIYSRVCTVPGMYALPWWGSLYHYVRASLVAQMVKNLSAVQETGFDPWVGKIPWRREWLPTPVFLPGEFHEQGSFVRYSPWGHKELDTTERLTRLPRTHLVRVKHYTRLASSWCVYCVTEWCSCGHPLSRCPSYLTVCALQLLEFVCQLTRR